MGEEQWCWLARHDQCRMGSNQPVVLEEWGTLPRGNTNWGKNDASPFETGRRGDNGQPGSTAGDGKTYTGSGPSSGVTTSSRTALLTSTATCGNGSAVSASTKARFRCWPTTMRLITPRIKAQALALWKAIKAADGSLVAPGTAGTLKHDAAAAVTGGGAQAAILSDSRPTQPTQAATITTPTIRSIRWASRPV